MASKVVCGSQSVRIGPWKKSSMTHSIRVMVKNVWNRVNIFGLVELNFHNAFSHYFFLNLSHLEQWCEAYHPSIFSCQRCAKNKFVKSQRVKSSKIKSWPSQTKSTNWKNWKIAFVFLLKPWFQLWFKSLHLGFSICDGPTSGFGKRGFRGSPTGGKWPWRRSFASFGSKTCWH